MALYTTVYDSSTGRPRRVAYPGFLDTVTTPGSPTQNFTVSGVSIDSDHAIDVWVAGRMQTEGTHYSRNTGQNRIEFSVNVPAGDEVKIRVFLK